MVDNNYPYNSPFSNRNSRNLEPTDMLVLGDVEGSPGETVEIPVILLRGESESELTGLVSGFAITHGSGLELPYELEFIEAVGCMKIDVPTYKSSKLPETLKKIPITVPGSRFIK